MAELDSIAMDGFKHDIQIEPSGERPYTDVWAGSRNNHWSRAMDGLQIIK